MKYEFTGAIKVVGGVTFKQIRAITAFGLIAAGTVGGWIEKESNLARVSGNARRRSDHHQAGCDALAHARPASNQAAADEDGSHSAMPAHDGQ